MTNYVHIEDMTWPGHWDSDEVEYCLRHTPELASKGQLMYAASVMAAYRALIECSEAKRRLVVRGIRKQTPKETEDTS